MVAGIMVSASTGAMNSLLGKLATLMGDEFSRLKNLQKEVKFISDELTSMKDALEGLSYLGELDPQTKRWRDVVRDMSYDLEDNIDDFMQNIGENNKTTGFLSNIFQCLKTLKDRHRVAGQIEDIKKLVLETGARRQRYKLDVPPSTNLTIDQVAIDPRVATLYENTANPVGVDGPTNELLNLLAGEDKELKLKVVAIVGFGGLGKTTLANVIYGKIKGAFDSCAFLPVSQKPNMQKLLCGLLSQLGIEPSIHACESSHLIQKLREHLQNKRYLIVIDDIWDVKAWGVIKCAFPENNLGSRVIVTTRIQDVARACSTHGLDHILEMKPLSDEDSRKLFFGRTFGSETACPRHLGDVSVKILKKCGGLPLAIISISSMLASEGSTQKKRWEHVKNSLGSGIGLTLDGTRQILNLSYKDLPPRLKTCLLYIGMYPEDYRIERSYLERQWIAEGFICEENGCDVENVARNVFNELVNRSLIQPIEFDKQGSATICNVHDMMLDLILIKCTENNFLTIVENPQDLEGLEYKARRLSIRLASNGSTILPRNMSMSQVRSIMLFGRSLYTPLFSDFKFLRVIFIHSPHTIVDFTGLCNLYQLRCLQIACYCSYQLPIQIRALQHLETIDLVSCYSLPSDVVHLPRLMHLNVQAWLPNGIGKMKSLRHFNQFDWEKSSLKNINDVGELTNLRYLGLNLDLMKFRNKETRMDALCSSLGRLCRLNLKDMLVHGTGCMDGLMPLTPPPTPYHLESLVLGHPCWFSRVPIWMGELRNLTELECKVGELRNDGVDILAELPALIDLDIIINEDIYEMIVMCGRGGAFPALKRFQIQLSSPSYLTFQAGAMPKLQKLLLKFYAYGSQQNGAAPAGIEHLLALEELFANIGYVDVQESDKTTIESAFRNTITMHPSHPRIEINFWADCYAFLYEN